MYDKAWTLKSMQQAASEAERLSSETGVKNLPCDQGPYVSPRYDIIKAPQLGDPISKAINGDYYPVGYITKVSTSFRRVETSTGLVFYRRKESSSWINDGCWYMVAGHIDERNPSFSTRVSN